MRVSAPVGTGRACLELASLSEDGWCMVESKDLN